MTETNAREVKADTEVLNLEDTPAEETVTTETEEEDDLDEVVIPPVEDEEALGTENAGDDSKKGETEEAASAESSTEGSESEAEKPADTVPSQKPAPVPGETPREKALRMEVQRLRGLNRKKSVTDLVDNTNITAEPGIAKDGISKLKELGYTDDEIKKADALVDILVSSKGYVKQSQNYQGLVNDQVEAFINANPEFKPDNDPEDVRWETFQRHLSSGLYNINGKSREQLQAIFKKVKADVDTELGEPTTTTKAKADEAEGRKKAAEQQKIKSVSHSGGTKPTQSKNKIPIDPEVRKIFKGFDDADLE